MVMVRACRSVARGVAVLLVLTEASVAVGQGKPRAPATPPAARLDHLRQLRAQGEQAMHELRYSDALEAFGEVYRETDDPVFLYNLSRAYQGLARYPEALDHLERFRAQAPEAVREQVPQLDELIAQTRKRVTWLVITADRPGARVLLRGAELGRTPLPGPVAVVAGEAKLEVVLDGYFVFERSLTLRGGERQEVTVSLLSRDRMGLVSLRSEPAGALVRVDGKPLGMSPVEFFLDAGDHRLLLTRSGFVTLDTALHVDAGERREVALTMARQTPITSRWWFWAGVGAVVAGGVALTYALTTEKAPPHGSIGPGYVQSGLARF